MRGRCTQLQGNRAENDKNEGEIAGNDKNRVEKEGDDERDEDPVLSNKGSSDRGCLVLVLTDDGEEVENTADDRSNGEGVEEAVDDLKRRQC